MKRKFWFNILLYTSFAFLFIALYSGDYFRLPSVNSYPVLFVSFFFLWGGFVLETIAWKRLLHIKDYQVSSKDAIVASGLSVFAKYIPGKIMIVLSRSAYLNKQLDLPLKEIGILSLFSQLLNLLVGGVIGLFCFRFWELNPLLVVGFVMCLILLFFVCFSPVFSVVSSFFFKKVLKKTLTIPKVSFKEFLPISFWFFLFWFCYAIGFWLLCVGVSETPLSLNDALFFPSSMVAGVLALFAPGGLGVREGVLAYFLTSLEWSRSEIIGLTITTRLWFLIGEVLFFLTALLFLFLRKTRP